MEENYNGLTISYQEHSNTFICYIDEVSIEADSLIEVRKKIDKYHKKIKQKPIICYVNRYGQIYEAKITSITDEKIYYTYIEDDGSKRLVSDRISYINERTFKIKNGENDKRFLEINSKRKQMKTIIADIKKIGGEFEYIDQIPGIEFD